MSCHSLLLAGLSGPKSFFAGPRTTDRSPEFRTKGCVESACAIGAREISKVDTFQEAKKRSVTERVGFFADADLVWPHPAAAHLVFVWFKEEALTGKRTKWEAKSSSTTRVAGRSSTLSCPFWR